MNDPMPIYVVPGNNFGRFFYPNFTQVDAAFTTPFVDAAPPHRHHIADKNVSTPRARFLTQLKNA